MTETNWWDQATWRERYNLAPLAPDDPTSLDRRWLWRLEALLRTHGTTDPHRVMWRDLHTYLVETCGHYWQMHGSGDVEGHGQCGYCGRTLERGGREVS